MRMWGWIVLGALTALLAYLALVAVAPRFDLRVFGTTAPVVAQAISFPAVWTLVLGMGAVAATVVAVIARAHPLLRNGSVVLAVLAVVTALAWAQPWPTSRDRESGRLLSVVTWNTEGALTADALAAVLADSRADVLVLPETSRASLDAALAGARNAVAAREYARFTSGTDAGTPPVSVLTRKALAYRAVPTTQVSYGTLLLTSPSAPRIIAAHPAAPVPALLERWRREVPALLRQAGCSDPHAGPTILAGDLNSSRQHGTLSRLGRCVDVQEAVGNRWAHTWPTSVPAWLGTTIDHVIVSGGVRPESARVLQYGVSDHRALLTTVRDG